MCGAVCVWAGAGALWAGDVWRLCLYHVLQYAGANDDGPADIDNGQPGGGVLGSVSADLQDVVVWAIWGAGLRRLGGVGLFLQFKPVLRVRFLDSAGPE
jgi:hypothetical protein